MTFVAHVGANHILNSQALKLLPCKVPIVPIMQKEGKWNTDITWKEADIMAQKFWQEAIRAR